MARRKQEYIVDSASGADRLMLLYVTLILILLSFFVYMVAQSNFDESKYANAVHSLRRSFGTLAGGRLPIGAEEGLPDVSRGFDEGGQLMIPDIEISQIRAVLAPALMDRQASIIHTKNQRIISLSAGLLFNYNDDAISETMAETLLVFAKIMAENKVPIAIEGHTDNLTPQTQSVGDNWDIATRRAMSVLYFLTETGGLDPARLSVFSYAGNKPFYPNMTPQGRARNNRVDLVLDFSKAELADLKNLAEKATGYNFKGFEFLFEHNLESPQ